MPGLEKDEFKLECQAGAFIISGERKEKKEEKGLHYLRTEQYHGEFRRKIALPEDANAEAIKAVYKNGILTVTVPRLEVAKPKAIPISVS
jgi:HSP20 family protein